MPIESYVINMANKALVFLGNHLDKEALNGEMLLLFKHYLYSLSNGSYTVFKENIQFV